MRIIFIFLFAALALRAEAAVDVDSIVAVVNDEVITESELESRIPVIKKQLARQSVRMPPDDVLRRGVLDRMVIEKLQLQMAARAGISVTDAKIDQAVQRIARENRMEPQKFADMLKRDGMDMAAFRQQVRTSLVIQQLVEREIDSRISVSESEVTSFLERNPAPDVEYNLSHILIGVPESATPAVIQAAQQRAQSLHDQLKRGADFDQLAIANSQGAEALEAGSLGWKKPGQLPALFLNAVQKMAPGNVSDVIRSANGFHILRLNDRRGAAPVAVVQHHVRHLLVRPTELLSPADAERKVQQLRARIENGADFAALAKAQSDDTGSSANGGDIGWINPGQTVPEFERAVNELAINELSEPVRSPFGFHLIQVLERRTQDVTGERLVAVARNQIHARKADERHEQWLRQLRDEAYVEYKVN